MRKIPIAEIKIGDRFRRDMGDHFGLKRTGLVVKGSPPIAVWLEAGEHLKYIQGSVHWWLGDWLRYGEGAYGEKYSQALDETDYSYQTLRDDVWVAEKIDLSRRRDSLSWSHHQEVTALEPEEQNRLLDLAEREQWKGDLDPELGGVANKVSLSLRKDILSFHTTKK